MPLRDKESRPRHLTPLLTPLRAQHPETMATTSTEVGLSKPILQRTATPGNRFRRIVAPKVAGSSSVGYPSTFGIDMLVMGNSSLLQLAEDPEQRLAGTTQPIVDPPAAAVRFDQLGYSEPGEVGRDSGGAQVELPCEFGGGAWCGK